MVSWHEDGETNVTKGGGIEVEPAFYSIKLPLHTWLVSPEVNTDQE